MCQIVASCAIVFFEFSFVVITKCRAFIINRVFASECGIKEQPSMDSEEEEAQGVSCDGGATIKVLYNI